MKKLLTICTVFTLLCCLAGNAFAADIIIKVIKIKKKHPKITGVEYPAQNQYRIEEMKITTVTDAKEGTVEYTFEFEIDAKKDAIVSKVAMDITLTDEAGKTETIAIASLKTGPAKFKCKCKPGFSGKIAPTLTGADITISNPEGEAAGFEAKLKEKSKDECSTDYKLKDITFSTDNVSGFYVMNFSFDFDGKDVPEDAAMLVQVTDCKGNKATVKVKLSYDDETGIATGTAGLLQNKECQWTLTYGEVYGYNPCGDETTWSTDFGKVKTSGAGTRSTTGTTQSTRPELK